MTTFAQVVTAARTVGATSSRTAKIALLAELLRGVEATEIEPTIGFLVAAPRQGKLGVGFRTIGDLSVTPAAEPTLTVAAVDAAITRLADTGGTGSTAARQGEIVALWAQATPDEQDYLAGVLLGEVRIGALAGVVTDALAVAAGMPLRPLSSWASSEPGSCRRPGCPGGPDLPWWLRGSPAPRSCSGAHGVDSGGSRVTCWVRWWRSGWRLRSPSVRASSEPLCGGPQSQRSIARSVSMVSASAACLSSR